MDPPWFATNAPFNSPTELLTPDHYVFRMLCSAGVSLEALGIPHIGETSFRMGQREIWRLFADKLQDDAYRPRTS